MIQVSHLTKRYGAHVAVNDVSFDVGTGEVLGFLGPNGAGKSTTLRILAGFLGATSGSVAVGGHDVATDSIEARRSIGYMPESAPLYPEMRVVEYLRFRAELKRLPRAERRGAIEDAMGRAGVLDVAHRRIGHLSKGYRQRVGLADALVGKPPILILDEPTAGLDPNQIRDVRQLVRDLGREHTVVLSTHILSEVEACATRVLVLHRGKVVASGPTGELRTMRSATAVLVTVRGDAAVATRALGGVAGVAAVAGVSAPPVAPVVSGAGAAEALTQLRATFDDALDGGARDAAIERCVAALVTANVAVRDVRATGGSLEDVFSALTSDEHEGRDGGGASDGDGESAA